MEEPEAQESAGPPIKKHECSGLPGGEASGRFPLPYILRDTGYGRFLQKDR